MKRKMKEVVMEGRVVVVWLGFTRMIGCLCSEAEVKGNEKEVQDSAIYMK